MPVGPIVVSGLTAAPGIGHIGLQWVLADPNELGVLELQLDTVEVWAAATNNRAVATQVANGRTFANHIGVAEAATRYYWIRPKNRQGAFGDWHPSSATAGVSATAAFTSGFIAVNGKIVASVSGNALTVSLKTTSDADPSPADPVFCQIDMGDGSYFTQIVSAPLSVIISSGSTLATVANKPFALRAVLFSFGPGTPYLSIINCQDFANLSMFGLPETNPRPTYYEDGAGNADSANVFYVNNGSFFSARYAALATLDWTSGLATPGMWSAGPSAIRMRRGGDPKPGDVINELYFPLSSMATGGSLVPYDDTIPTSGEGNVIFSTVSTQFTPERTVNLLEIESVINCSYSVATKIIATICKGGASNALAAAWTYVPAADVVAQVGVVGRMQAGQVTPIGFDIHVGGTDFGTLTVNGAAGARKLGGVLLSYYKCREIHG